MSDVGAQEPGYWPGMPRSYSCIGLVVGVARLAPGLAWEVAVESLADRLVMDPDLWEEGKARLVQLIDEMVDMGLAVTDMAENRSHSGAGTELMEDTAGGVGPASDNDLHMPVPHS